MKRYYTQEKRDDVVSMHLNGESIMSIHEATGIARSTIYNWVNSRNSDDNSNKPLNKGDYNKLKMHCEKLENIIQILKTCGCTVDAPLQQRYDIIKELS